MSSTGTSTKSSRALRLPASTISTGRGFHAASSARPARGLAAAEEARDLLERPLRRGEPDPLEAAVLGTERLEPLEREEEVRAALGRGDRVDLVDDDGLDRREHLARLRGQQEVERLRRRDQDVGRRARDARALRRPACRPIGWPRTGGGWISPRRSAVAAMPAIGARRLRSTSTASAFRGET